MEVKNGYHLEDNPPTPTQVCLGAGCYGDLRSLWHNLDQYFDNIVQ